MEYRIKIDNEEGEPNRSGLGGYALPSTQKVLVYGNLQQLGAGYLMLFTKDGPLALLFDGAADEEAVRAWVGQDALVEGMAHYWPNGQVSHLSVDGIDEPGKGYMAFARIPHRMTTRQVVDKQRREGKKSNPHADMAGQWLGDEELDEMMAMLWESKGKVWVR